jgi:hypothetical protein
MRDRALRAIQRWASRQIERRLRAEWDAHRESDVEWPMFRRRRGAAQVSRSLVQINFIRSDR